MSLSKVDLLILADLYVHLDNPPSNISDNIGRNRSYVSQRLETLEDRDLVAPKGGGNWRLTYHGTRSVQALIAEGRIEISIDVDAHVKE